MYARIRLFLALCVIASAGFAQDGRITSSIRGKVLDLDSEAPVPFATVTLADTEPPIGTFCDEYGNFELTNVPVGRHTIQTFMPGYEPATMPGLLVTSGKALYVEIKMKESVAEMETIVIRAEKEKDKPLNHMATVSARQLSMEEANKYAGGADDPARLVASFAGVASDLTTNGIVIRGNAPKGLLWRLEGVEVPNPNHFGELAGFGAGGITALSSQMLANSDFMTGAFPAEYGNALSGVFDLSMRRGNVSEREHTLSIGTIGADVSSEGPIKKGGNSSYLFNYRYSSLALVDYVIPIDLGINYQDLAFKFHFPTRKAGVFSLWGLGFIDRQRIEAEKDSSRREYLYQLGSADSKIVTGITGLSHQYFMGENTYLKTILAASSNELTTDWYMLAAPAYQNSVRTDHIHTAFRNLTLTSFVNHKFSAAHTNRTGFVARRLYYDMRLRHAESTDQPLEDYVDARGNSALVQAYSQSSIQLGRRFVINPGINLQHFALSGKTSIEPRFGARWRIDPRQSVAFGYGEHSRIEKLNFYLGDVYDGAGYSQPNKQLDFSKARHFVLSYDRTFGKNTRLKIEPYYQYLYNIPVIPDSSFSFINLQHDWFINNTLVNKGEGENIGIDFTLERFLNQGWFYLITASVFDSKYKGGDGVWRNTMFNRQFISNILLGKEWVIGKNKQNQLSVSGKLTFMRGERWTPVDAAASLDAGEVVYQHARAFETQAPNTYFLHSTITYRINRKKHSSLWSLQILNTLGSRYYVGPVYNMKNQRVDDHYETVVIPNFSYKIQF